ncbi:MAG: tRNA (adenosine(37)-N6)-threonylcarbamoyltransferase complex dimerization subunit type 1 TsaB [Candidatus Falkowbacteria bacterium]
MKLIIDTTDNLHVDLSLIDAKGNLIGQSATEAFRQQGEKLLPAVVKLLKKNKLGLKDLNSIGVANGAGNFSSLRIGIVTANALAYALGIPVTDQTGQVLSIQGLQIVEPAYTAEPNIGKPKGS